MTGNRGALPGWRTWPWWVQVLAVHGAARAVSAAVLLAVARTQAATPWAPAGPSYSQYVGLMWDGSWYRGIAEDGYPATLPRGADGQVLQNAWAFFPLFPAVAGGVARLTGGPWHVVAPTVSLVLGALAMLLVHRVVAAGLQESERMPALGASGPTGAGGRAERVRRALPLATVAVLTTAPAAPVLQAAYTESLALLLLAAALWCLQRRRDLLVVPLVLALGLTRAVALPLAVAVGARAWASWRAAGRGARGATAPDVARHAALVVACLVAGLLWPTLTGWFTGEPAAYTLTQSSWRGTGAVVPVRPWLDVARWLAGGWGPVLLVGVVALAALATTAWPLSRMPVLQGWTAGYLGYLLAVVEPGTSLVRFSLLAFPVAAVLAGAALRSRWPRVALGVLLLVGVAGQVAWVALLWRLVPPSGWPP